MTFQRTMYRYPVPLLMIVFFLSISWKTIWRVFISWAFFKEIPNAVRFLRCVFLWGAVSSIHLNRYCQGDSPPLPPPSGQAYYGQYGVQFHRYTSIGACKSVKAPLPRQYSNLLCNKTRYFSDTVHCTVFRAGTHKKSLRYVTSDFSQYKKCTVLCTLYTK